MRRRVPATIRLRSARAEQSLCARSSGSAPGIGREGGLEGALLSVKVSKIQEPCLASSWSTRYSSPETSRSSPATASSTLPSSLRLIDSRKCTSPDRSPYRVFGRLVPPRAGAPRPPRADACRIEGSSRIYETRARCAAGATVCRKLASARSSQRSVSSLLPSSLSAPAARRALSPRKIVTLIEEEVSLAPSAKPTVQP